MDKLEERVLVLNKTYFPVGFINVRDAMKLVFLEKASIMDINFCSFTLEEWFLQTDQESKNTVCTVNRKYAVPEVIKLTYFDEAIQQVFRFSRQNIFYRDQYTCQYCNKKAPKEKLTLDHIIPKSRSEEFNLPKNQLNSWENVVCCCQACNVLKDNRTPEEANMPLIKKPSRPKKILKGLGNRSTKKIWNQYLGDL